ncbi:hypothetical protein EVAR_19453_1 [Eumeta japonica]|uniref:Uncharacterized protein n=1 Tax=Eumeta variegata TaxID=151549 RepID=A0A4C1V901_EUMVA|nr:hypothetical protein EVAR_19453_1 [Eumeta japonica]
MCPNGIPEIKDRNGGLTKASRLAYKLTNLLPFTPLQGARPPRPSAPPPPQQHLEPYFKDKDLNMKPSNCRYVLQSAFSSRHILKSL